jgi:hypothetical protein
MAKLLITLLLMLPLSGCGWLQSTAPKPCSPEAQVWVKRTAGAGVIAAGECDEVPLEGCPALGYADRAAEAYRTACTVASE